VISTRTAARGAAALALTGAAFGTAFVAHALLAAFQAHGVLAGDYGEHAHASVGPVAAAAIASVLIASACYVLHVAALGPGSLPTLARWFKARLGLRSAMAIAAGASAVLIVMESAEQLGAGHFDGIASAFGSVPLAGLAIVVLVAACATAVLARVSRWMADAHERIAYAIARILWPRRGGVHAVRCTSRFAPLPALAAQRLHHERINGLRAPPVSR
jgi:hypothetical protein